MQEKHFHNAELRRIHELALPEKTPSAKGINQKGCSPSGKQPLNPCLVDVYLMSTNSISNPMVARGGITTLPLPSNAPLVP